MLENQTDIIAKYFLNPLQDSFRLFTSLWITFLAAFMGLLIIPALLFHHSLIALALLIASALDTLDGTIAHEKHDLSAGHCM